MVQARIEQGRFEMEATQMDIYEAIRLFIVTCVAISFLFVGLLIAITAFMEDRKQINRSSDRLRSPDGPTGLPF